MNSGLSPHRCVNSGRWGYWPLSVVLIVVLEHGFGECPLCFPFFECLNLFSTRSRDIPFHSGDGSMHSGLVQPSPGGAHVGQSDFVPDL